MGDRWAGCLGGAGVMGAVWGGDCWPYGSTWELTERGNPHSGPEWTWSETDALHHATPDPCLPMHPHPATDKRALNTTLPSPRQNAESGVHRKWNTPRTAGCSRRDKTNETVVNDFST